MSIFVPGLFVLSAPSGTGKTSIVKEAQKVFPNLVLSVSYTTRAPREGEVDGVDYNFISEDEFQERIKMGDFLEWAEVYGNYYGTSREFIERNQKAGNIVLLDIDVQGAMQLKETPNISATYIFITPPSLDELKYRLSSRGTETEETLSRRLGNAEHELTFQKHYDFTVVNDTLEQAAREFISITLGKSIDFSQVGQGEGDSLLKDIVQRKEHTDFVIQPVLQEIFTEILTQSRQ